jgi:pimeloyl-ACP methyl ester carboxylesterase
MDYMTRPGAHEVQLDLFLDYASNVDMYSKFQEYFRQRQPPLLAVWGNRDPFFLPAGAEAFRRDVKKATITFFDTGHFALETHCDEIAVATGPFCRRSRRRLRAAARPFGRRDVRLGGRPVACHRYRPCARVLH